MVAASKTVSLLDPNDLTIVKELKTTEEADCADLSPDFKYFAVGAKLKAKEYDIATGTEHESHKGHHGPVRAHTRLRQRAHPHTHSHTNTGVPPEVRARLSDLRLRL